ncbi:MAG: hypothetical protein RJA61_202 [Candidatus Parcubacteria bacterium]|jgi:hypothetical protein
MTNGGKIAEFKPHLCTRCGNSHVFFKQKTLCPNCKLEQVEESHIHFEFIPTLLELMKRHKRAYNRYTPSVWFMKTVFDEVARVCFQVFDRLEEENHIDEKVRIKKILDEMNWRKKGYLKIHSREIIAELYKGYAAKKPRHSVVSKLRFALAA